MFVREKRHRRTLIARSRGNFRRSGEKEEIDGGRSKVRRLYVQEAKQALLDEEEKKRKLMEKNLKYQAELKEHPDLFWRRRRRKVFP